MTKLYKPDGTLHRAVRFIARDIRNLERRTGLTNPKNMGDADRAAHEALVAEYRAAEDAAHKKYMERKPRKTIGQPRNANHRGVGHNSNAALEMKRIKKVEPREKPQHKPLLEAVAYIEHRIHQLQVEMNRLGDVHRMLSKLVKSS